MLGWRAWRRRRWLKRAHLPDELWAAVLDRVPPARLLRSAERHRLRDLVLLFLREKSIEGADGAQVTDAMRLLIAAWACLLIVNLELDAYDGWVSVIVYPDHFRPRHEYRDETGVVHQTDHFLSGEAWERGPVVLSWSDVEQAGQDGGNVIVHEFAHKLDMENGVANGMPPLHRGMDPRAWTAAFSAAFEHFQECLERGVQTPFDAYAAESPAEFFAVMSEAFFHEPVVLAEVYPAVYEQLRHFYRQDPAGRLRGLA